MQGILDILASFQQEATPVIDHNIALKDYVVLDLSESNIALMETDLTDHESCQLHIDMVLRNNSGKVAYGGYLEKRNLYARNSSFSNEGISRNIHLGLDFWAKSGTKVMCPLDGKVHSFRNNSNHGDYGPTIILEHEINNLNFHTLYGHLSVESLKGLHIGKQIRKAEALATLGSPDVNVGYAPHLHFQLVLDMQDYIGDYPGVCAEKDLQFYSKNCPDPNLLLKIRS